MNCQNCEAPVDAAAEHCGKCGAKLLRRRIVFGAPRREEFVLTAEDQSDEGEPGIDAGEWQIDDREVSATPIERAPEAAAAKIRYGGFFRRLCAAVIDLVIVLLLSAVMGGMAYIGYKVGLRAHDRALTTGNMTPLLGLLTFGWALLVTAYFVLFHGMEGQTIGKWLLRLRVCDNDQIGLSYRVAWLRWMIILATLGLSFLVVPFSRRKRGLHDVIAGSWVIRE